MYLVTLNDNHSYTIESVSKEEIINNLSVRGDEVELRNSRIYDDFEFVVINGMLVAKAFYTQAAQINYLLEVGKL